MLRRPFPPTLAATLLAVGLSLGLVSASAQAQPPTAPLTVAAHADGSRTLSWSLQGSSDKINVLPNLRCELGPAGSTPQFDPAEPCLWLVDHDAPLPAATPAGCLASREPGVGGPAPYASWRCDMRWFRDVVIHAAQNAGDRSFVMFNTTANGGSGVCATISITVLLGHGRGELQAADGCPQTIRCAAGYRGTVRSDARDTVTGCGAASGSSSPVLPPGGAGGAALPATGDDEKPVKSSPSRKAKKAFDSESCRGAKSGRKGQSPLYSVLVKARGKRGMKIYVHLRRAVPITLDVRIRRGRGRDAKIVRWVGRCGKKGTNVFTLRNATGGAKDRRNYRVYVKSPNSSYPLRSSWEALPRR